MNPLRERKQYKETVFDRQDNRHQNYYFRTLSSPTE